VLLSGNQGLGKVVVFPEMVLFKIDGFMENAWNNMTSEGMA